LSLTLLILFSLATAIQLVYGIFFSKIPVQEDLDKETVFKPVSILICAKNEAQNLKHFLPSILEQDFPIDLWEVVVVNDASTDESGLVLDELKQQNPHLKILTIPENEPRDLPGKKYALDKGIAAIKFENILLTDADCQPHSNQWLKEFSVFKSNSNKQIILGYGKYQDKHGILNQFIRWETIHTAIQYFSFSRIGKTYMGVGRNLMYEKSLYFNAKKNTQFWENYRQTPSGDDDLLISQIANNNNTAIYFRANAQTISIPQLTWKAWWRQKTRHLSTGKYYSKNIKSLLGLYGLTHSIFWVLGILLLIWFLIIGNIPFWTAIVLLFIVRIYLFWKVFFKWTDALQEKKIFFFFPVGDIGWSIYNVFLSPYIFWRNKQKWK